MDPLPSYFGAARRSTVGADCVEGTSAGGDGDKDARRCDN
jgi:hypothetical protein